MLRKMFFIGILTLAFFLSSYPIVVNAEVVGANSQIPELNPFCWKKKDCIDVRRGFVQGSPTDDELARDGFVSNASVAPCNSGTGDDQWGRCLPAGVSKTEIDFGGKSTFANIGIFILSMYNYLVTVASIVAVIMIIVAGLQWVTSGGNSEAISSAKHRIGGAVVGLFIAYMSYFILNTINPNLVNFRIPQVWLVRPQNLIPQYCSDIPNYSNLKYAYLFDADKEDSPLPPLEQISYKTIKEHSNNLCCGCVFLPDVGGTAKCLGDFCAQGENNTNRVCVRDSVNVNPFNCYEGDLSIHLSFNADITDSLKRSAEDLPLVGLLTSKAMDDDWLYFGTVVRAVCKRTSDGALFLANGGEGVNWDKAKRIDTLKEKKIDDYYEYQEIYKGLSDPVGVNKNFDCSGYTSSQLSTFATPQPQIGTVVGYFIRYELAAKEAWVKKYSSVITGAKIGAVAGWLLPIPGIGAITGGGIGAGIGWVVDLFNGPPRPNLNVGYQNGQAIFGAYANSKLRADKPVWEQLAAIKNLDSYIPIDRLRQPGGLRLEVSVNLRDLGVMMLYRGSVPKNEPDIILPADTFKDSRHIQDQEVEHGHNI